MTRPNPDPLWLTATALVVEPGEAERALLASTLRAAGLTVATAGDYALARAAVVRRPPSVLITEIRLERHNGLHLAHLGRSLRPRMIQVVTSAHSDAVLTRDAEAIGAVFVQKPFAPSRLLTLLHDLATLNVRRRDDDHRER